MDLARSIGIKETAISYHYHHHPSPHRCHPHNHHHGRYFQNPYRVCCHKNFHTLGNLLPVSSKSTLLYPLSDNGTLNIAPLQQA